MSKEEYGLLVSFPDQSETFVLGFEAGQLFEALKFGQNDDLTMHSANEEMFRRIARHYGYTVEFEAAIEGWSVAKFKRSAHPKLRSV